MRWSDAGTDSDRLMVTAVWSELMALSRGLYVVVFVLLQYDRICINAV